MTHLLARGMASLLSLMYLAQLFRYSPCQSDSRKIALPIQDTGWIIEQQADLHFTLL